MNNELKATQGTLQRQRMTPILASFALICLLISTLMGVLAALYYLPSVAIPMEKLGVTLQKLRPIHVTMASSWIFLAAISVVYHFLNQKTTLDRKAHLRFRIHTLLWIFAGTCVLISLLAGIYSGREYLGFHPLFSLFIYIGWLFLAYNFFQTIERGFLAQPVYIYMWAVGLLFFLYTFAEAHSWLLPQIYQYPLVDMQLQWKSAGTMVGSMNLLVYGSLAYLGSILNKGQKSCQTRLTFALFGIGLLNSFTNYTHHTYHLPQSQVVKWIGFVVSMSEAILLWRLVIEVSALWRQRQNDNRSSGNLKLTRAFIRSAKTWTLINLFYSLLISIPPLNTMIHGTHVVFAHAMGSMIGIDTMILLSVLSFFAIEYAHKDYCKNLFLLNKFRLGLNFGLFIVVATMTYKGILDGFASYMGESRDNHTMTLYLFACGGFLMAISLIGTALIWLRVFLPYFSIYKAKYIQTNPEFWHHEPISHDKQSSAYAAE